MLKVFDKNMNPIGVLENAYNASVKRYVNEVWEASFNLPADDPKNNLCSHLNYIEIRGFETNRYYGLYRIMPVKTTKSESDNSITYECEHVLATLLDDVMEGYHQFTNYTTIEVLQEILNLQETKRWELGNVEFERFFHYSFEDENGLLAPILSIPQPFAEQYEFTFDTTVYPWKLNLIRPSDEVKAEIRWGKDMISFDEVADPTDIVNYIIPKGAGEGVNRLNIADVNNGKRYLLDQASIDKWGKRKYIWPDKRFEDAESLKASAQSLLNQWKDPKIAFECAGIDLSILPEFEHERRLLNGVTRIIVEDKRYPARIITEEIPDLSKEYEVNYEIANRLDDIATTQADVERKIAVNDAYSQGATNILSFNYQDNCDNNIPALIPFYIDDDVFNINTCELTFRTKKFRAYSRATEGGGATVKSTSSGGGTNVTSSSGGGTSSTTASGGGTSKSTESGGGSSETSNSNGEHRHRVFYHNGSYGSVPEAESWQHYMAPRAADGTSVGALLLAGMAGDVYTDSADGEHTHSVSIPNHSHNFTIPSHKHEITIENHTHDVEIEPHTHEIELPDHTHEVKHEIIELSETPSTVQVYVDGNLVDFSGTSGNRIDLMDYLQKDDSGKVTRGRHEVELSPNTLARIEADLILRVFIRSHLGGTY